MDASGLYYFNARYYDPELGRFLQEDPAKQGSGWYAYCSNDPVNRIDLDGRMISYDPDPFGLYDDYQLPDLSSPSSSSSSSKHNDGDGSSHNRKKEANPLLEDFEDSIKYALFNIDFGYQNQIWATQNFNEGNYLLGGINCLGTISKAILDAGKAYLVTPFISRLLPAIPDAFSKNTGYLFKIFSQDYSTKFGWHKGIETRNSWNIIHIGNAAAQGVEKSKFPGAHLAIGHQYRNFAAFLHVYENDLNSLRRWMPPTEIAPMIEFIVPNDIAYYGIYSLIR